MKLLVFLRSKGQRLIVIGKSTGQVDRKKWSVNSWNYSMNYTVYFNLVITLIKKSLYRFLTGKLCNDIVVNQLPVFSDHQLLAASVQKVCHTVRNTTSWLQKSGSPLLASSRDTTLLLWLSLSRHCPHDFRPSGHHHCACSCSCLQHSSMKSNQTLFSGSYVVQRPNVRSHITWVA